MSGDPRKRKRELERKRIAKRRKSAHPIWSVRSRDTSHLEEKSCPKCNQIGRFSTVCFDCLDALQELHAHRERFLKPKDLEGATALARQLRNEGYRLDEISMLLEVEDEWVRTVVNTAASVRDKASLGAFETLRKRYIGDLDSSNSTLITDVSRGIQ